MSIVATEYGRALFLLAEENGSTERVKDDLSALCRIFSANPKYQKLLDTPALSKNEKLSLIDGALVGIDGNLVNLIKILCERHSVYQFDKVCDAFSKEYDESRGIERVEAVTAIAMTPDQITAIKNKLSTLTGKTIVLKNTVEPSILGGVKLRYSGIQLDGSVKTRLDRFEKALKSVVL